MPVAQTPDIVDDQMDSLLREIVFHPPADLTIDPPRLLDAATAASEAKKA